MTSNGLQISLDTLIGVAPMLGHVLADHRGIRERQDRDLVHAIQEQTSVLLRDPSQQALFGIAPFDILVTKTDGRKRFHMLEINGTGIGGLCNMTVEAIEAVLDGLRQTAQHLEPRDALVLVASSGKEDDEAPRLNKALHEKVLYVDALRRGFEMDGRSPHVTTSAQVDVEPESMPAGRPVVVLGYIKDLLKRLRIDDAGQLFLGERQVHAAINDRFCLNVLHHFDHRVDLRAFQTMNRCFQAGGDKGLTYGLWNRYLKNHPHPCMADRIRFERAFDRAGLIDTVCRWLREGRKTVIKPQGTGLGDGIEFFLANESETQVAERIDTSLGLTERRYGLRGGAFPYTVCDFIDTLAIDRDDHPLHGHKFELRVPVYRDGMVLRAFPMILKIASEKFDPAAPSHMSLINNTTASVQATHRPGVEFMLPLANRATWDLIGVTMDEMLDLCAAFTGFTRYLLDEVQDEPTRLGLPDSDEVGQVALR